MCGYANGVVKKVGGGFLKIVHEKYRAKHAEDQEELHQRQMEGACVCGVCVCVFVYVYICVCVCVCMYLCV